MKLKRTELKLIIFLIATMVAIAALLAGYYLGGHNQALFSSVRGYDELLQSKRSAKEINPPVPYEPKLNGFKLLYSFPAANHNSGADNPSNNSESNICTVYATGDYLYFSEGENCRATDGKEIYKCENLTGKNIKDGKYIYGQDGLFGLKDIFGSVLVPCEYQSLSFAGDTAIAQVYNIKHIYYRGILSFVTHKDAFISNDPRYVVTDFEFYDAAANGKPLELSDVIKGYEGQYRLFSPPSETFLIYDPLTGKIGYADGGGILIEPTYDSASLFENGCAQASDGKSSYYLRYESADSNKIVVTKLDEKGLGGARIAPFYGSYAIFYDVILKEYGILDEKFNIAALVFNSLSLEIFGGFALDLESGRFYDIEQGRYSETTFLSAARCGAHYACRNQDGKYVLIDEELNEVVLKIGDEIEITDFEFIAFCPPNGVLFIHAVETCYIFVPQA